MKRFSFVMLATVVLAMFTSCTDNSRAKNWGGTQTITLAPNEVLVNMTWKDNNLWILTKDTTTGVSYFREQSAWGMLNGKIIVK